MHAKTFFHFFCAGLLMAVMLGGCASVHKQAFNKGPNEEMKMIGLLEPAHTGEYFVANSGHIGQSFGLIGGIIAATDIQTKTNQFTELMKARNFNASDEFQSLLQAELQNAGYIVKIIKPERQKPAFLEKYDSLDKDVDAYLDLGIGVGYQCASSSADYIPVVRSAVRLVKKGTNEILYQDIIAYGYEPPHGQAISITANQKYFFKNFATLKENPDLALAGLKEGLPLVAKRIAQDLAR
ncbi:MAG: hypothetical protein ABSA46_21090 [Thermodesulfovibrionales bacterium]|jgi:hypothetical protein